MIPYPYLMVHALTFAVYALACARVTGIPARDKITERWRDARTRRWCALTPPGQDCDDWRAYLIRCMWCLSLWGPAPVAATVWWLWPAYPPLIIAAAALAFSQITGMISDVGR